VDAKPVTVEPIEAFPQKEEPAIEALLVAQEDWPRANLSNYPPRPADFKADAARDDHARRQAFLEALRVAPDIKLALFVQPDPSTRLDPARMLPYAAVSTLPSRPLPSSVLAGSTRATLLRRYPFSPRLRMSHRHQLLGGRPLGAGQTLSLSGRCRSATHRSAPFVGRTDPLLRVHQFFGLAELAFVQRSTDTDRGVPSIFRYMARRLQSAP
jgi:hypothetical protein